MLYKLHIVCLLLINPEECKKLGQCFQLWLRSVREFLNVAPNLLHYIYRIKYQLWNHFTYDIWILLRQAYLRIHNFAFVLKPKCVPNLFALHEWCSMTTEWLWVHIRICVFCISGKVFDNYPWKNMTLNTLTSTPRSIQIHSSIPNVCGVQNNKS